MVSASDPCMGMILAKPLISNTSLMEVDREHTASRAFCLWSLFAVNRMTRNPALLIYESFSISSMTAVSLSSIAFSMSAWNSCALTPSIRPSVVAIKIPPSRSVAIAMNLSP